jgi:hypothetical protein
MFAFVAEDTGPDDEGIIGMSTPLGWMPLVGGDMARIDSLRHMAQLTARNTGKKVKLLCFSERKELEVIG